MTTAPVLVRNGFLDILIFQIVYQLMVMCCARYRCYTEPMQNGVILQRGKDRPIRNRHHWIFSGAVKKYPKFKDGDILPVFDFHTQLLGYGYFNRKSQIVGRMLSFDKTKGVPAVRQNLLNAYKMRRQLVESTDTNSYRLVSGEADNLPGLVIDRYDNVLVVQISTLGMEKLKPLIVEELLQILPNIEVIYERSDIGSRRHEGLEQYQDLLFGKLPDKLIALENGNKFEVDVINGHKTGFYLDQREMRDKIGNLSGPEINLLNCFSYNGGFSVYAAKAGAQTTSVDISAPAIEAAKRNFKLNSINTENHKFIAADVFEFLNDQSQLDYDIVILDPPAFAKKKQDIKNASKGYRSLNQLAISKAKSGSLLLTCSCSYHVGEELFRNLVLQAAAKTGRKVRIVGKHALSPDHAINIYNSEQDYLKSLLLHIE